MDSRKYHICRDCGHLRISHKYISKQSNDHHCYICSCTRFFGYDND